MNRTPGQTSSNTTLAIVIVCVAAVSAVLYFVLRPVSTTQFPTTQCIQVPEVTQETQRKPATELALKLEKIKVDSELKAHVEEISKTAFQTLPEKELALLILLRAIDCYSHSAKTPEQQELIKPVLKELVATIRSMWASQHDLKGEADRLSLKELTILKESHFAEDILGEFEKHGINQ